jgi:5-hydroxydodecatetraenal polyketide synthase CpkB
MLEFGSSLYQPTVDTVGEMVREITAEVLRDFKPGARWCVDPVRSFREQGLDSLARTELRIRLCARTGLDLPADLTRQYQSPAAVADYLRDRLGAEARNSGPELAGPDRMAR